MKNKLNWLEAALVLAPFVAIAILWNQIPARIPMHWNIHNEVDSWSSSRAGIFSLPLIGLGVIALFHLLPRLDPRLRKTLQKNDRMNSALPVLCVAFVALFDVIFVDQLTTAFGYRIANGRVMTACLLVFLAILGNYLGTMRPNYFVGLRTPWTLESAATWRATHRLGGHFLFFGALFLLVLNFFLNQAIVVFLLVSFLVLFCIWTLVYSWHHFRTHGAMRETV
jgi:uncharacterized membrane protein